MKSRKHMVQSKNKNGCEDLESNANIFRRIRLLRLPYIFSILIIVRFVSCSYSSFPAHVVCYAKLFAMYFKTCTSCFRYLCGISFFNIV